MELNQSKHRMMLGCQILSIDYSGCLDYNYSANRNHPRQHLRSVDIPSHSEVGLVHLDCYVAYEVAWESPLQLSRSGLIGKTASSKMEIPVRLSCRRRRV